ncbi:MAG: BamA/TamA family outer membrane protein, partial [Planctomycetes bacterium]|nr:BamA/TamA family outer membrane protein [Planctomycetota bacterium]
LRVTVVPVTLESVDVEGSRWSRPSRLERPFHNHLGNVVGLRDFSHALQQVNQHPFRRVTPLLAQGEAVGTTKLKLVVAEDKPWQVFSGYSTTNSRNSGRGRLNAGFMAAAPWRTEDTLTAQYSTDAEFKHLDSVSASYRAALPWGHYLTVTGLWAQSDSSPARLMDYKTTDWLAGLEYAVPLPEFMGWSHEASLGWEWRRFEGQYYIAGIPWDDGSKADMAPFSLAWRGWRPDRFGLTSLSGKATWNPGDYLGGRMNRAAYAGHRAGADPGFTTFSWEARRDWRLPADFRLQNRVWGQFSGDRLVDPARFFLGGNRSIRGYRESELGGDGGWGVTMELLSPALKGPSLACRDSTSPAASSTASADPRPEARLAAFWDWGQVYRNHPREMWEGKRMTGAGAGIGLRANMGPWAEARVDYGWRLRDTGIPEDDKVRGYLHVSVHLRF